MTAKQLLKLQEELENFDNNQENDENDGEKREKLISPNTLRSNIRKYLSESGSTQSKLISELGVNSNSYNKFMNGVYKDQWSALQNGTYYKAKTFLERYKIQKKINDLTQKMNASKENVEPINGKRSHDGSIMNFFPSTSSSSTSTAPSMNPPLKKNKSQIISELTNITEVPIDEDCPVYANCDEMRKVIDKFLMTSGVNQTLWLNAIGGAQANSLNSFRNMNGKGAGASNKIYRLSWRFFEQKRILDNQPKSAKRLEQEARWGPAGFPLEHDDGKRWQFQSEHQSKEIFDIEWCRDRQNGRV